MNYKKILATSAMGVLLPTMVEAGEPLSVMNEVVVTATKTEAQRSNIVNSIITIDSLDIEESTAQSFGELLSNKAGIDFRTYGDYGGASSTLQLRGMASDETLVLINGVPLNSPSTGAANVSNIPLENIQRVEVVKGAGSLLYGSGAMAGVINIITKDPDTGMPTLNMSGSYGTDNAAIVSLQHGMFLSEYIGVGKGVVYDPYLGIEALFINRVVGL